MYVDSSGHKNIFKYLATMLLEQENCKLSTVAILDFAIFSKRNI